MKDSTMKDSSVIRRTPTVSKCHGTTLIISFAVRFERRELPIKPNFQHFLDPSSIALQSEPLAFPFH
jgi:hypothetical protein